MGMIKSVEELKTADGRSLTADTVDRVRRIKKAMGASVALFVLILATLCQAAVTVEDAYAFAGLIQIEHPDSAPSSAAVLSSVLAVPTGAGDDVHMVMVATSGASLYNTYAITSPGTTEYTHIGVWLAIENPDLVVDTDVLMITFGPNDGANIDVGLRISSTGGGTEHSVHIVRATGTNSSTDNDLFEDDVWYWLELFYLRHDTTGACSFYLTPEGDDTRNLIATVSGTDFNDGAGGDHAIRFTGQIDGSAPFGNSTNFNWKNLIIEYGITSVPSEGQFRMASMMSAAYQSGTTSDDGDNLSGGDWINTIDSSLATRGEMAPGDAGGIVADSATGNGIIGPKDQFGSGAVAIGAKWAMAFRENGTADNGLFYGNYDGGSYSTNSAITSCTGNCFWSVFEAADGSYIPDIDDEWFFVGADNENLIIGDLWVRELRTYMFSSFPYDAELSVGVGRAEFRAQNRARRTN